MANKLVKGCPENPPELENDDLPIRPFVYNYPIGRICKEWVLTEFKSSRSTNHASSLSAKHHEGHRASPVDCKPAAMDSFAPGHAGREFRGVVTSFDQIHHCWIENIADIDRDYKQAVTPRPGDQFEIGNLWAPSGAMPSLLSPWSCLLRGIIVWSRICVSRGP